MNKKEKKLYDYLKRRKYLESRERLQENADNKGTSTKLQTAKYERKNFVKAIKHFQAYSALPITGRVNKLTIQETEKARCGFRDRTFGETVLLEAVSARWDTFNITYAFRYIPQQLGFNVIKQGMREAFEIWKDAVPDFNFREVAINQNHLIEITFTRLEHNDSYPFFGPEGDLAHAFLPNSSELPGDIHFDSDDQWSVDDPATHKDFITVAAHEIGHSLGLEHSFTEDALMFGPYKGLRRRLHTEDKQRIQSLYS